MYTQLDFVAVYRDGEDPVPVHTILVPHGVPNLVEEQVFNMDLTDDEMQRYALHGMTGYIGRIENTVDHTTMEVVQYVTVIYFRDNEDHHTTE